MKFNDPIEKYKRAANKAAQKGLKKMGIKTIRDLLFHFPNRYIDFTESARVADLMPGETATINVEVLKVKNSRTWKKRMFITEAVVSDQSGLIKAIWFNQPFLANILQPGKLLSLSGKVALKNDEMYLQNPSHESLQKEDMIHTSRLVPVYPETKGMTSRWLRYLISPLLDFADKIPESIPDNIRKKQKLITISEAIKKIHFPPSFEEAEDAKKRLAFGELFLIQLSALKKKREIKRLSAASIPIDLSLIKKFVSSLPFRLTDAQRLVSWEILQDIEKPHPMNRLLQGDVGSGKTVVAALAALNTAKAGHQTAFMAPTEVLANQHFHEISKLLAGFDISIGLLTASSKKISDELGIYDSKKVPEKVEKGEIKILIGTHSLIGKKANFKNLALTIIDEQHRFGVKQRKALLSGTSASIPHLLSMTATPIPRTLTLTIYGDLDVSLINEMPKNRQKIETKIVLPKERERAYQFIRAQIEKGRQTFVICPRIEPKDTDEKPYKLQATRPTEASGRASYKLNESALFDMKSVKEEYEKLSKDIFPDLKIAMLHGKLKAKEKNEIMKKFKEKEFDILVSTSVIEVGIDIQNATIMMIEGAERFGLAQLHQFRGRVGRDKYKSYCFLMCGTENQAANKRLRALQEYSSGFDLAQIDLEIRGPGDFYGSKQSGLPDLTMASLADIFMVKAARTEAEAILKNNPTLTKHPLLKKKVEQFRIETHFE